MIDRSDRRNLEAGVEQAPLGQLANTLGRETPRQLVASALGDIGQALVEIAERKNALDVQRAAISSELKEIADQAMNHGQKMIAVMKGMMALGISYPSKEEIKSAEKAKIPFIGPILLFTADDKVEKVEGKGVLRFGMKGKLFTDGDRKIVCSTATYVADRLASAEQVYGNTVTRNEREDKGYRIWQLWGEYRKQYPGGIVDAIEYLGKGKRVEFKDIQPGDVFQLGRGKFGHQGVVLEPGRDGSGRPTFRYISATNKNGLDVAVKEDELPLAELQNFLDRKAGKQIHFGRIYPSTALLERERLLAERLGVTEDAVNSLGHQERFLRAAQNIVQAISVGSLKVPLSDKQNDQLLNVALNPLASQLDFVRLAEHVSYLGEWLPESKLTQEIRRIIAGEFGDWKSRFDPQMAQQDVLKELGYDRGTMASLVAELEDARNQYLRLVANPKRENLAATVRLSSAIKSKEQLESIATLLAQVRLKNSFQEAINRLSSEISMLPGSNVIVDYLRKVESGMTEDQMELWAKFQRLKGEVEDQLEVGDVLKEQ